MNQKFLKIIKTSTFLLIVLFLALIFFQKDVIGQSLPGEIPSLEITEEQEEALERLLEMPTGKMNDDIWLEITMQISCLLSIDEEVDEAKIEEMVKPYGVTGEEYTAYHWQTLINRPDVWSDDLVEEMTKKFEDLKENNCQLEKKSPEEESPEEISSSGGMTDDVWLEITARIKCIDRVALIFTKDEIETIFEPFEVTPVEYQTYTEDILERMEEVLKKSDDEWTEEDRALAGLNEKLKQRIEELKKKNCILENGVAISEEYNAPVQEPEGWDKTKCRIFSCDNCFEVTEDSSWWARYRCNNLCKGCPTSPPTPPPVDACLGFCSQETCPAYADKITGDCASQKKCRKCGPFKIFKCCEEVASVCCLTKPPEVCQGSCGWESCPEGTVSAGEKNCSSKKETYRCGLFKLFKCSRTLKGACCVSQDEIN